MSITTKKGDKGRTSLYLGDKVSKDNIIIEALGTVDELCSCLGFSRSLAKAKTIKETIQSIQEDLFRVGAEFATNQKSFGKLKNRINIEDVSRLEKILRSLENTKTFKANCFYLPGENTISASLDIARAVARRAERRAVTLKRKGSLANRNIIVYLNRLSDLLYLLARSFEKSHAGITLNPGK
ncbi:MAG: cob(I)yrinic acid a,c-diamide adenosyltransferase [Candidatus Omnitrophica bacterium]|nr:cob(I)yrinic acid a,c-diamide adenosyltransferase [Candidatus Omnitrophota bacterium]